MIKIENIETMGWESAIRGMRNPMNSWYKGDSYHETFGHYIIGRKDLNLMMRLAKGGSTHAKYRRMITVYMDVTAPLYWWSEYDTYKVGTVANSCSKMHKLLAKPFEMSDFSFDHVTGYKREVSQFVPELSEEMVASEQWKVYDDDYDVSNYGRIRHKFKTHYRIIGGSKHKDGYIFVTIHGKQIPLHRIICGAFHGDTFVDGNVVNHIDGNKQNNFADNLEWVTQKENIAHSIANGFQPKGLSSYKGKFTDEERNEIKRIWNDGELSKRQLAKMFSVSHTCINDIINDKYKYAEKVNLYELVAIPTVDMLNELRDSYIRCENEIERKRIWYSIIQLLPESYNQRRTLMLNYEVLSHIYHDRKDHKLDEWRDFCQMIRSLPYSQLITLEE